MTVNFRDRSRLLSADFVERGVLFLRFRVVANMATLQRPGVETTPTERAEIGAEEARLEGKGPIGEASEAAKNVVTGRDDNGVIVNNGAGPLGNTEEEFARLRTRTLITHEGEAYCPNPNIRNLVTPKISNPFCS